MVRVSWARATSTWPRRPTTLTARGVAVPLKR